MNLKKIAIYTGSTIASLLVAFLLISSLVAMMMPSVMFNPQTSWAPIPNYGYETTWLKNSAGQNLSMWSVKNTKSDTAVLYLHGNGGRIGDFFVEIAKSGQNVFSPTYSGYGESDGKPSMEATNETAVLAFESIVKQGFAEDKIIILGHSMGGSPATYLANKKPKAKKLILINTFSSAQSMCFRSLGIFCGFAGDFFNTAEIAKTVTVPLRQFAYKGDTTVPFVEGQTLFGYFEKSDKKFVAMEKDTHSYPDWSLIVPELK